MTLIDVDDVPDVVRQGHPDTDLAAALAWASSQVESYCGRRFGLVVDDQVVLTPFRDRSVLLPDPPVVDVSAVQGWVVRDGAMSWVDLHNYAWTTDGLMYDTAGLPGVDYEASWPVLPNSLRVTYTHGFADIPQPVKDAVLACVGGYFTDPTGTLAAKQVDDVRYQWSGRGNGATVVDENLLSAYRLVSV